jgi:hypothetical protein
LELAPIAQLTSQMGASKAACGMVSNGFDGYFCNLDDEGVLHNAGPHDMHADNFWMISSMFTKFALEQKLLNGELVFSPKAAATGAQDDHQDNTGDDDDVTVLVPGPGLGREFDHRNYQTMMNEGAEGRPQVWLCPFQDDAVIPDRSAPGSRPEPWKSGMKSFAPVPPANIRHSCRPASPPQQALKYARQGVNTWIW